METNSPRMETCGDIFTTYEDVWKHSPHMETFGDIFTTCGGKFTTYGDV
ncbi:unnamed protein product [Onchocerca flexuosa]|uniref:Cytochrome P450 n=1 Tax=Onchocerca flexuosa TaxID=387005 RepID=A0A183HRY2_9BILA|nr:unnamed protein product [Onchocerca flexuosa]